MQRVSVITQPQGSSSSSSTCLLDAYKEEAATLATRLVHRNADYMELAMELAKCKIERDEAKKALSDAITSSQESLRCMKLVSEKCEQLEQTLQDPVSLCLDQKIMYVLPCSHKIGRNTLESLNAMRTMVVLPEYPDQNMCPRECCICRKQYSGLDVCYRSHDLENAAELCKEIITIIHGI
jgi:hypothetical protein